MRGDWRRRVFPWHAALPASERVPISRPRPCTRSPATRPTVARRNYQRRRVPTGFGSHKNFCEVPRVPRTQHSLAVAAATGLFMSHNETLSRSIILWESRRTLKCRNVAARQKLLGSHRGASVHREASRPHHFLGIDCFIESVSRDGAGPSRLLAQRRALGMRCFGDARRLVVADLRCQRGDEHERALQLLADAQLVGANADYAAVSE